MEDSLKIILICLACCCGLIIIGGVVWLLIAVLLPMPTRLLGKIPLQPIKMILSGLKLV